MKSEVNEVIAGGLLMLLFLLLLHVLCNIISSDINVNAGSGALDPRACKEEISAFQKVTLGIPVSINRESLEGLTAVPGIGPKIAGSLVRERDKRGGFKSLAEITSVRGIGPALYGKVRPYFAF